MKTNFGLLNSAVYEAEGAAGGAGGPGDAAAAAAAAAAAGGAGGAKPWYDGKADAETVGYFQNRGWDKLDAADVAIQASRAHREAEKFVGAPANELIRLPKDANAPEWKGVWQKLGAPVDGKYDLSAIKHLDGKDLDAPFVEAFNKTAATLNLPKDAAVQVAKAVVEFRDTEAKTAADNKAASLTVEKNALVKEWGPNFDGNMLVAKNAAAKLGVAPEAVAALEAAVGYTAVMKMFNKIGVSIGEARFVESGGGGGNIMTREQALATKQAFKNDTAKVQKFLNGDTNAIAEMRALDRIISGDFDTVI